MFRLPTKQNSGVDVFLARIDAIEELPQGMLALAATKIRDGRITLYLPSQWNNWEETVQREILAHEIAHICLNHVARGRLLDIKAQDEIADWNAATDAAIHELECCDWRTVDAELGFQSVTFERLQLRPMRSEIAYEELRKRKKDQQPQCGCGSLMISSADESEATEALLVNLVNDVADLFTKGAGGLKGTPGPKIGELPPTPPWITRAIEQLLAVKARSERCRSWRRFNRAEMDLLPGRGAGSGYEAQIFVDQSGSINDALLKQFLAAILGTPELAQSEVYFFDTTVRGPIPANDATGLRHAASASRGGTYIKASGAMRRADSQVIWLTDGESGDGLPAPHVNLEIWCVAGEAAIPREHVIRIC